MAETLQQKLAPVKLRLRMRAMLGTVVTGLAISATLGLTLAVIRAAGQFPLPALAIAAVVVAGPLIGVAVALARGVDLGEAARVVDAQCGLQDRIATAVALSDGAGEDDDVTSAMRRLQLRDALGRLDRIAAGRVVPLALPRGAYAAVALCALAVAMMFWPASQSADARASTQIEPPPRRQAVTVAPVSPRQASASLLRSGPNRPLPRGGDQPTNASPLDERQTVRRYFRASAPGIEEAPATP